MSWRQGGFGSGVLMAWCHKCQKHLLTPHGAWCHIPFRGMALAPVNGKDSTTSGTNKKPTGEAQSTSLARRGPPREGRGWANVCARGDCVLTSRAECWGSPVQGLAAKQISAST